MVEDRGLPVEGVRLRVRDKIVATRADGTWEASFPRRAPQEDAEVRWASEPVGYIPSGRSTYGRLDEGDVLLCELEYAPRRLEGQVRTRDGQIAPKGIRVALGWVRHRPLWMCDDDAWWRVTRTDAEGRFRFEGLPASDRLHLGIDRAQLRRAGLDVEDDHFLMPAKATRFTVPVLRLTGSLTGRLHLRGPLPWRGTRPPRVFAVREGVVRRRHTTGHQELSAANTFVIRGLQEGTYTLFLVRGGRTPPLVLARGVEGGQDLGTIDVPCLEAGASCSLGAHPHAEDKKIQVKVWSAEGAHQEACFFARAGDSWTVKGLRKDERVRIEARAYPYGGWVLMGEGVAGDPIVLNRRSTSRIRCSALPLDYSVSITDAWGRYAAGHGVLAGRPAESTFCSEPLPEGIYTVICHDANGANVGTITGVRPGDPPLEFERPKSR